MREQVDFWEDLVASQLFPVRLEAAGQVPFRGEIQTQLVSGLAVVMISGQGVLGSHGRAEIARMDKHLHLACVHLDGETRLVQSGKEVILRSGDVFLIDSRHHFALGLEQRWRHLLVAFPTHWLESRLAQPDLTSVVVPRDQPLAHLWARHLADGFRLADALSPEAETLFAQHSVELLVQALNERRDTPATPPEAARAALFLRACRLISLEFGDPSLAPHRIASKLRVSTRTLERIFAEHNDAVMRHVYDERIRQAAKVLADAGAGHRSVTEIAFVCGFNDSSHFGRVFAERMHITPSKWRKKLGSEGQG